MNSASQIPHTEFIKEKPNFSLPSVDTRKLDKYLAETPNYFYSPDENFKKKKKHKHFSSVISQKMKPNFILNNNIETVRINSPSEMKDTKYFQRLHKQNLDRLDKLKGVGRDTIYDNI